MNRALLVFVVAIAIWCPGIASAKGAKTVHVRSYTRKDGTVVRAHMRSPPGSGSSGGSYSSGSSYSGLAPITPRTSYRTSARSSARTSYQLGALNAEADDDSLADSSNQPAAMPSPDPVSPPAPKLPDLPTRYIAHMKGGKTKALNDFSDKDDEWLLFPVTGGSIGYGKWMISYFEPTAEALDLVRTWTDDAGTHHATAKFSHIHGDNVILTKNDGKTVHIPIDKLSETDRDLAKRLQELKGKP